MKLILHHNHLIIGDFAYSVFENGNIIRFIVTLTPRKDYNSMYCNVIIFNDINSIKYEHFYKDAKLFGIEEFPHNNLCFFEYEDALMYSNEMKRNDFDFGNYMVFLKTEHND